MPRLVGTAAGGEVFMFPGIIELLACMHAAGLSVSIDTTGLIDIRPDGSANFCVDFIDYSFGNVREASIADLWNGDRAERFRELRRSKPLAVCYSCGAKFMSQPWSEYN